MWASYWRLWGLIQGLYGDAKNRRSRSTEHSKNCGAHDARQCQSLVQQSGLLARRNGRKRAQSLQCFRNDAAPLTDAGLPPTSTSVEI